MFFKSRLRTKAEKRESLRLWAVGVFTGVILLVAMQVLSDIFTTPAFFGMTIMLLSIIIVQLAYLVELKIREENDKKMEH